MWWLAVQIADPLFGEGGKGRRLTQPILRCEGNSPTLSQSARPQRTTRIVAGVPKQACSAVPSPVCPGRIPARCRLMFSLLYTQLPNRTRLFNIFLEFPLVCWPKNPDPHGKSRALGTLLLASTHVSPPCRCFPGNKKQVEGSSLAQQ